MNIELPTHLQGTADLLSRSLHQDSADIVPAAPAGLIDDLLQSTESKPVAEDSKSKITVLDKVRNFLAAPGFGLAAAALVIFGLFAPTMMKSGDPATETETFRGVKLINTNSTAKVVLITENPNARQLLEDSGLFDMDSVIETADPLVAISVPQAKLLVDVSGGTMVAYSMESCEVLSDELPEDQELFAERVALAFGGIQ